MTLRDEIAEIHLELAKSILWVKRETPEGMTDGNQKAEAMISSATDQILSAIKKRLPFYEGQPAIDPDLSPFDAYELARNNLREQMEKELE